MATPSRAEHNGLVMGHRSHRENGKEMKRVDGMLWTGMACSDLEFPGGGLEKRERRGVLTGCRGACVTRARSGGGANRALAIGHHHERLPDHEGRSHDEPQVDELVRKLWRQRSAPAQRGEERAG